MIAQPSRRPHFAVQDKERLSAASLHDMKGLTGDVNHLFRTLRGHRAHCRRPFCLHRLVPLAPRIIFLKVCQVCAARDSGACLYMSQIERVAHRIVHGTRLCVKFAAGTDLRMICSNQKQGFYLTSHI